MGKLLSAFFKMDDSNFARRYKFFYEQLAPSLDLYRVRVGDTLTIKAFTKSGYMQSVNLKVYGTFTFEGLEKSALAGELNLMDLVSFRELYGYLTDDKKAEIAALKAQSTAKEVSRENAEAALFGSKDSDDSGSGTGGGRTVTANATPGIDADQALQGLAGRLQREELASRVYDPKQLETGVVLNAAVILKDPKQLDQTMKEIEAAGKQQGLPLKAISWQAASGFIGQFVNMAQMVLSVAVLIIFVVALVIINNAMVMATLQRVQEIGTLRAVGAQRRFILWMLVIEAMVIGALFGALGAAVGAAHRRLDRPGRASPRSTTSSTFFFSRPARCTPAWAPPAWSSPWSSCCSSAPAQQLVPGLAGHAGHPAPGDAGGRGIGQDDDRDHVHEHAHRLPQPAATRPADPVPGSGARRRHRPAGAAERPVRRGPQDHARHRHHAVHRPPERGRLLQGDRRAVGAGGHRLREGAGRPSARRCPR